MKNVRFICYFLLFRGSYFWLGSLLILSSEKKSWKCTSASPWKTHSGFDASHVLQLPADQPSFLKSNFGLLSRRTGTLEAETSVNGKPYIDRNKREWSAFWTNLLLYEKLGKVLTIIALGCKIWYWQLISENIVFLKSSCMVVLFGLT